MPTSDVVQGGGPPASVPRWLETLVALSDDAISIPGSRVRVGLDALVGLLAPGLGDAAGAVVGLFVIWQAAARGVPRIVVARMLANVAIDALIGAVPLVGDVFDFAFKANRRNLELLSRHAEPSHRSTAGDYAFIAALALVVMVVAALPVVVVALLVGLGR